ncbi:putative aminopeptidase [Trichinella pseudospiralis]
MVSHLARHVHVQMQLRIVALSAADMQVRCTVSSLFLLKHPSRDGQQYLGEVLPFLTRMFKDPVRECTRRNHSASWQGGHPQLDRPDIYTAANEASMQHTLH